MCVDRYCKVLEDLSSGFVDRYYRILDDLSRGLIIDISGLYLKISVELEV